MVFKSIYWLATKISDAVATEVTQRKDAYMQELRRLHSALENQEITEEEFDKREETILAAIDALNEIRLTRDDHET